MQLFQHLLFLGKEMLFPRFCSLCHKEGHFLCESCFLTISKGRRQSQVCGHCGARETPEGQICFSCAGSVPHDGIFAALHYSDPRVSHLVHLFKYRFIQDLGSSLGKILALALLQSEVSLPDAIIPVPLHPRRERWRGWNQADILAQALTKNMPQDIAPPILDDILIRTKFTAPQMSLQSRDLRQENIAGAFQLTPNIQTKTGKTDIIGKSIWLVDDVAASGATLAACAKALKEYGAKKIFGIVVAR